MADLFTPWREPPSALAARHVDREDVCAAIRRGAAAFVRGERPVHIFAFGPAGSGSSHLLALLAPELIALASDAHVPAAFVPDDLPLWGTAERLVQAIRAHPGAALSRSLVLFDGLGRQLEAMDETERRRLRQQLDDSRSWLVATDRTLPEALTGRDTAFYGQFSPWPLPPLPRESAAALLTTLAGPADGARRDVLVALATGHPRSLVALGQACAAHPEGTASDDVRVAVQTLAADHRARFRALSPLGQQLLHAIAADAGPLTPSQLAERLAVDQRVVATAARRLAEDGVLRAEREGRLVRYELVDTLFRLWTETVATPWLQTRIHDQLVLLEAALRSRVANDGPVAFERLKRVNAERAEPPVRHTEGQMLADLLSSCSYHSTTIKDKNLPRCEDVHRSGS